MKRQVGSGIGSATTTPRGRVQSFRNTLVSSSGSRGAFCTIGYTTGDMLQWRALLTRDAQTESLEGKKARQSSRQSESFLQQFVAVADLSASEQRAALMPESGAVFAKCSTTSHGIRAAFCPLWAAFRTLGSRSFAMGPGGRRSTKRLCITAVVELERIELQYGKVPVLQPLDSALARQRRSACWQHGRATQAMARVSDCFECYRPGYNRRECPKLILLQISL